jgi:membrane protease YdiL (CAAX protease family)
LEIEPFAEAANWSIIMDEVRIEQPNQPVEPQPALWNFKDFLLITLGSILLLLVGTYLLHLLYAANPSAPVSGNNPPLIYNAGLAAVETIALVAGVYFLGIWRKGLSWASVGVKSPPLNWLWAAILIALIFIPIIGLVAVGIQLALNLPMENPQLQFLVPKNFSWPGALGMIFFGGITVPFAEELFFRGVLYRWLKDRWGIWPGILLSSAIFGALHGDIAVAGATAVMGLVLAWFYERSKSLWPSVIIHITNNILKLILLYALIASGVNIPGVQ